VTSPADQELWIQPERGPAPDALASRLAYWEGLERAFLTHAPPGLRWGALPTARPSGPHILCERWLPLEVLRDEVWVLIAEWFGPALAEHEVDLGVSSLGRARSWLDARAQLPSLGELRLPSQLLRRFTQAASAHDLVFELFSAPQLGRGLERHAAALQAAVREAPSRPLVAWDAGCAAGESTWALATTLANAGREAEVWGTSPWPLELLMATRREFPHDPQRTATLRSAVASLQATPAAVEVRFERGDLLDGAPPRSFDLISCHGLLGGAIAETHQLTRALEHLTGALAPGGVLSIQDTFREDVHARALAQARRAISWPEPRPGLFIRPQT
jgi:SAM-dependent methyltransferase